MKKHNLRIGILSLLQICSLVSAASSVFAQKHEHHEDPERIQRQSKTSLGGKAYMDAIKANGQLNALQNWENGYAGGTGIWTPIGPTGDVLNPEGNSPANGRISGIHIRPQGGSYYIYVGACTGGLWRALASDGVGVWEDISATLPNQSVRAFAVHPTNPDVVVVGTGDWSRGNGAGMFRGQKVSGNWTWTKLRDVFGFNPDAFFRILWSSTNPSLLVAAAGGNKPETSGGIFRSTNGGVTFQGEFAPGANTVVTDLVSLPTDFNTMYGCFTNCGNNSGVYKRTLVGGIPTWTRFTDQDLPTGGDFGRASIAICRDAPQNLALVVETGLNLQGLYKSVDGGTNWTNITNNAAGCCHDNQWAHAQAIAFRPNNPNDIYLGSTKIAKTNDGGATWLLDGAGHGLYHGHDDITQLYFSASTGDNKLWICNDGGVYQVNDSGAPPHFATSWNGNGSTGLRCSQIDNMDAQDADLRVGGLQDNGVIRSDDTGASWLQVAGCDGLDVEINDDINNEFWYNLWCGGDYMAFRQPAGEPSIPVTPAAGSIGFDLFYRPADDRMYLISQDMNLLSNSDSATSTWPPWVPEAVADSAVFRIFGSEIEPTIYVTYWNQPLSVFRKIGSAWTLERTVDLVPGTAGGHIKGFLASRYHPGECWAGFEWNQPTSVSERIFHTTDDWQTWEDVTNKLAVGKVTCMVERPSHAGELFIGTDLGVFQTTDGGENWQPFQTGMPIVSCSDLRYIASHQPGVSDKLVVSTFGRGMYERVMDGGELIYVNTAAVGVENGSFEHPFNTYAEGMAALHPGGRLVLRGNIYHQAPVTFNAPMSLDSYVSPATITN